MERILADMEQGDCASEDDKRRFEAYASRLEYITFLINRDRVDFDYISELLRCDIIFTIDRFSLFQFK